MLILYRTQEKSWNKFYPMSLKFQELRRLE